MFNTGNSTDRFRETPSADSSKVGETTQKKDAQPLARGQDSQGRSWRKSVLNLLPTKFMNLSATAPQNYKPIALTNKPNLTRSNTVMARPSSPKTELPRRAGTVINPFPSSRDAKINKTGVPTIANTPTPGPRVPFSSSAFSEMEPETKPAEQKIEARLPGGILKKPGEAPKPKKSVRFAEKAEVQVQLSKDAPFQETKVNIHGKDDKWIALPDGKILSDDPSNPSIRNRIKAHKAGQEDQLHLQDSYKINTTKSENAQIIKDIKGDRGGNEENKTELGEFLDNLQEFYQSEKTTLTTQELKKEVLLPIMRGIHNREQGLNLKDPNTQAQIIGLARVKVRNLLKNRSKNVLVIVDEDKNTPQEKKATGPGSERKKRIGTVIEGQKFSESEIKKQTDIVAEALQYGFDVLKP
jgi:hypothetical protein